MGNFEKIAGFADRLEEALGNFPESGTATRISQYTHDLQREIMTVSFHYDNPNVIKALRLMTQAELAVRGHSDRAFFLISECIANMQAAQQYSN